MKSKKIMALFLAVMMLFTIVMPMSAFAATDVKSWIVTGSTVGIDEAVQIRFVTADTLASVPDGVVTIEGVSAEQSYDPATKTVSVKPFSSLTLGKSYIVKVDAAKFTAAGLSYSGVASYTVTARESRITAYGTVINDTFDDGTACGWASGAGNTVTLTPVTLDGGEKVLKAEMPVINTIATWAANGQQSTVFKKIGGGITYTGSNLVKITARVKNAEANDGYAIKVNRPNATSQGIPLRTSIGNVYAVSGLFEGKPMYGQSMTDLWGESKSYKNMGSLPIKADGTTFDYAGVDLTGKWIDYTIIIDGATNNLMVYASFEHNGETVTLKSGTSATAVTSNSSYNLEYGRDFTSLEQRRTFNAFEALTFASKDASNGATIYIDSVTVENIPRDITKAEIPANTEEGIIYKPTELTVNFDGPINYVDGGITITNQEGITAPHTGEYDPQTYTYTATFPGTLAKGNYILTINPQVTPVNHIPHAIPFVDFEYRTIMFDVYDSMPPAVEGVEISGRLIPGRRISVSDYDFSVENDTEGAHIYDWLVCDTAGGEFTSVKSGTEDFLDIDENLATKYIKVNMTAVGASGLVGYSDESNVLAPEAAPVAKGLKLSLSTPMENKDIAADYVYEDTNGDAELGTVIKWYLSDTQAYDGREVGTGNTYRITSKDAGKYIYCTVVPKNGAEYLYEGDLYPSEIAGPILLESQLLESTNLLLNPSFEDGLNHYGAVGDWSPNIEPLYGEARTGDISLCLHKRATDPSLHASWGQEIEVDANKRYLAGCYALSVDGSKRVIQDFYAYIPGMNLLDTDVNGEDKSKVDLTAVKFTKVVSALESTANATVRVGFTSFVSRSICDANVDDMYFGELLVSDIETNYVDRITIPTSGEKRVSLTSGAIYNQLGTQHGLYDQTPVIEIPETTGVYVDGFDLVVTERASVGTITADIVVRPSYPGASQSEVKESMTIELLSHGNDAPRATDVVISGTFGEGNTLTGTYNFLQVEGKADASSVRWLYADEYEGSYYEIPNATSLTYTVESQYADKFICMEVTPKTADGMMGATVRSNVLTKDRAPVMVDVNITGSFTTGTLLTAGGTVADYNGLAGEPAFEYKWYIADSENGPFTVIEGQSANTLYLKEEYTNKYFKVGVTPIAVDTPSRGEEALSKAYCGPAAPFATNVGIKQQGTRLIAEYTYNHIHGVPESGTLYRWMVDGAVVSTNPDYTINFNGTKTVTLSITPYAANAPKQGQSVIAAVAVTGTAGTINGGGIGGSGSGSSTGGIGGGGGTGGGSVSGVTSVNDMTLTDPSKAEPEVKTDIKGHWGETYIREIEMKGVMSADENGNFDPDKNVSREEMLTFLFKALGLEMTEYKNEFTDVTDGDFAKMLQTMVDNGTIAKDTNFRPNDTITREEMCKILYISLKNANKLTENDALAIETFADFTSISDWAKAYVNAIYTNKIMVGISETHFDPQGTVTKAQAATMLARISRLIEGGAGK